MENEFEDVGNFTVSIMLTNSCNFHCAHCMYDCTMPKRVHYISMKNLQNILEQASRLAREDVNVSINLVGGEPTLRMDKFKERLGLVFDYFDFDVNMTTNGWWFDKESTTRQFFNIITPYVDSNGTGEQLSIRISNDTYHRPFRKYDKYSFKERFDSFLEEGYTDVLYKYSSKEYIQPNDRWPYIYSESDTNNYAVIPNGRGVDCSYIYTGECHMYGTPDSITYDQYGNITDVCCRGSNLRIGNSNTDIFRAIRTIRKFLLYNKQNHVRCTNCKEVINSGIWRKQ